MLKTDVVVIGAGAVGCAVARELSKYEEKINLQMSSGKSRHGNIQQSDTLG